MKKEFKDTQTNQSISPGERVAKNNKRKKGNEWGFTAAFAVLILFGFVFYFNDKDINHIIAIFGAYVGFKSLGEYFVDKERSNLAFIVGGLLLFIASFVLAVTDIWNL